MLHILKKRLGVREEERHSQGHPVIGGQCQDLKPSHLEFFPYILCPWLTPKYILTHKQSSSHLPPGVLVQMKEVRFGAGLAHGTHFQHQNQL